MPPPLENVIDPGWARALRPVEDDIHSMGMMLRQETASGRTYLPEPKNILRAFCYPFEDVKVLIVGQDPYPTVGDAVGLSFAVAPDMPLPASLRNIYQELTSDLGCAPPSNGDLSKWADQGVCLLNRVLTVEPGRPGSHRGRGWEKITEQAITSLVARNKPLVAVLWGRDAASLKPLLGSTATIESPHPSPLSAYRGFFGSKPFSTANRILEDEGASPIEWC